MARLNKKKIREISIANQNDEVKTYDEYWNLRIQKMTKQMEKPETTIFQNCVFYVLGFIGRGDDSRFRLAKEIEKNGGRTTLMITSHTTHVISTHLCHSKRKMLDNAIEKRKLFVVSPNYIKECIKAGKLLEPDPFITARQKSRTINSFFPSEPSEKK